MLCNKYFEMEPFGFPATMTRRFRLEYRDEMGCWQTAFREDNNFQRLVRG